MEERRGEENTDPIEGLLSFVFTVYPREEEDQEEEEDVPENQRANGGPRGVGGGGERRPISVDDDHRVFFCRVGGDESGSDPNDHRDSECGVFDESGACFF